MAEAMPDRRMRTDGLIRPGGKTARHAEMVQHQGENHKAASNLSVSLSAGCKAGRHTPRQAALANVRPSYLTLFATIKLLSRVRRLFGKQLSAASCSPDFRRSRGSARTPIAACPWIGTRRCEKIAALPPDLRKGSAFPYLGLNTKAFMLGRLPESRKAFRTTSGPAAAAWE